MKINIWLLTGVLAMAGIMGNSTLAQAQNTKSLKQFTLEDLNFGGNNYHNMTPKNRFTTWWGDELVRLDLDKCYIVDKKTGKETVLFTLDEANRWLGSSEDNKLRSLYYAEFPYSDKSLALLQTKGVKMLLNFKTHQTEWKQSTADIEELEWNPLSRAMAFTGADGYNLFVRDAEGHDTQISTDASRNILYGKSVHRDEFGYTKGTFWSPDGQKLIFTRMDQSMVTDYPLVNIPDADWKPESGESRIATPAPEKYPMAGETMHKVTIGVYDLQTHQTVYLKAGDPTDRYFTNPAWSADSKTVYLFELNRDQNDCRLVSYDAKTGNKIAELYRETDDKYVEPLHPIQFLPWDDSKFILQSQKDGYNHIYLFNKEGKQLKQLTSGQWVVMEVLGFDKKHKGIIIASNERNPLQRNLYLVDVKSGKRKMIDDNGQGYHYGTTSASGEYVLDRYSTPTIARNIAILNPQTNGHTRYFTAENPWKEYNVPEYKSGTIKAADGTTDLYYRMVMPVGFDPSKKYPTIVYVYGGPHAHNVDASWHWGSRYWETYMAQKGYLLFILDNRGSENRGKAFEQTTFRRLGENEVKDQMEGVRYLKSLPYVDAERLGVHGWSFGGFITINMMTTHPDVFKVGVAGGPVIDWRWYEVMYGERYMDTPQTNPEGYAECGLLQKAKDLKGKLQIIIGLNDPVVVPQHALTFIKQCILDGTQPDFFVYPGEPHNMRGHQSTHLHERISQYFEDYLK
ncbi:MAG: DPP IV N-terminal domain-containing protein [Prevotella sp.]|nr:DPP IV N-terminal domain-containing protein [Prevotella sp.]